MPRRNKRDEEYDDVLDEENDDNARRGGRNAAGNPFVVEELGQIAPAVPIKWVEVEQGDWPFSTPEDEFVRSPFPLDMMTLCERWRGLWKPHEIEGEYARRNWDLLRFEYQDKKQAEEYSRSIVADSEYQKRKLDDDLRTLDMMIAQLKGDLAQGVEYRPIRGAGAFGYVKMPMTVESKNKITHQIIELQKQRRVAFGLANEIKKSEMDVKFSLADEMHKIRARTDPGYASLLKQAGLDNVLLASQQGELEPGKQVWDVTKEAHALPIGTHMVEDRTQR